MMYEKYFIFEEFKILLLYIDLDVLLVWSVLVIVVQLVMDCGVMLDDVDVQ